MKTTDTTTLHAGHPPQHFLRALTHDLTASFMLLEHALARLKQSLGDRAARQTAENVAQVDACLRQSQQLLDELSRLARTGHIDLEPGRADVATLLDEVRAEQGQFLAERGVDVQVERPLPAVWCNPGRLKQVLTNLVRNAALHGCDPAAPQITVAPNAAGGEMLGADGRRLVAFEVRDNGPGIDPRVHREIFLPGRRVAPRGAEGSGLGLAIVAETVARYGGRVFVDPDGTRGTAIVVVLPAADETAAEPVAEAKPKRVKGRRVQVSRGHAQPAAAVHRHRRGRK